MSDPGECSETYAFLVLSTLASGVVFTSYPHSKGYIHFYIQFGKKIPWDALLESCLTFENAAEHMHS